MPKVKSIKIVQDTPEWSNWSSDFDNDGSTENDERYIRLSLDVEFDRNDLKDHYISILCLNQ